MQKALIISTLLMLFSPLSIGVPKRSHLLEQYCCQYTARLFFACATLRWNRGVKG